MLVLGISGMWAADVTPVTALENGKYYLKMISGGSERIVYYDSSSSYLIWKNYINLNSDCQVFIFTQGTGTYAGRYTIQTSDGKYVTYTSVSDVDVVRILSGSDATDSNKWWVLGVDGSSYDIYPWRDGSIATTQPAWNMAVPRGGIANSAVGLYDGTDGNSKVTLIKIPCNLVASPEPSNNSFAENTTWYTISMSKDKDDGNKPFYIYNQGTATSIALSRKTTSYADDDLWCFVGNLSGGYKMYNKGAGTGKFLSASTTMTGKNGGGTYAYVQAEASGNNTTWDFSIGNIINNKRGYFIGQHNSGNNRMNDRDKILAFWTNGADDGSTFFMNEVVHAVSGTSETLSEIYDYANIQYFYIPTGSTLNIDVDGFNLAKIQGTGNINIASGKTLVVNVVGFDLTRITGEGNVTLDVNASLANGEHTSAKGTLTVNEGKTLSMGSSESTNASVKSFSNVVLKGILHFNTQTNELNNVTIPENETGVIFSDDMGKASDGFKLALKGTTTINVGAKLITSNHWNFQSEITKLAGSGEWEICGATGSSYEYGHESTELSYNTVKDATTFTGTINLNSVPVDDHPGTNTSRVTVEGNLIGCTLKKTSGDYLYYSGNNLNGTTMDGVNLTGNSRVDVAGTLNLANISNNHTGGSNGYVFAQPTEVSNVVMNFTGTSDLTNGGNNAYNKIGLSSGSIVNVNSGSLKLGGYFNGGSNGSLYVASGATFETTGSSNTNNNITFPSSTIAGTAKLIGTWQGTSAITLNDGAVLEVAKTVAGKLTVADGASVTVRATSTADLTKYGDASYSDGSDGLKIQGYKIATDESSNVTAVNIGDNTYDVSGGLFSADDGIYHVLTEVSTSSKDISSNNILVANNATLTVDDNLTMADGKKITAESGGSIAINEGFTLDASAQAANHTEHRGLITATSGDGTLKLSSGLELINASDPNDNDLVVNTNIVYTNEGRVQLIGTERAHDHLIISAGKSFSVNGDLEVMRSKLTVNGTVVANTIKLGHSADGAYTGVLNINDGATVQTGQIYFQNKGGNSALNMTGGTLEFRSDNNIESAIGKKTDATYSISITGGTIKASANATIPAGIAMSIGNVTIETADEKSLAMSNDLTLTGTITNNGTLSLNGALNAETLTVFADGGEGSSYSDGTNGFLSAKKNIVANGDGASTSLTAEQITVGGTDYDIEHEGTGRATVSTEGTSGAYYINEGGDTEYSTVVAKLLTEGDNIVLNGGVLTMDDKYSKPISMARNSTVVVSEGTSLSQGNITGNHTLTINGAGTYNTNYSASVGLGATLGSNWTGTVARANGVVGGPFNINNMVNASMSKAQLTHVSGWIQQGSNTTANIVLVNGVEPDDYGFCVNGANSNNSYYFSGDFSGDGDFVYNQNGGGTRTPIYHFSGDLSAWTGKFNLKENGTGTTNVNITSTDDIGTGFVNTSTKANTLKVTFESSEAQNIKGKISNSNTGNGSLVLKLLGTGAKTISADIDVSRLKIVKDNNGAEITISGTPTISVGQLDVYTDDNNTAKTSLNIDMSRDDIIAKIGGNASCALIDVADGGAVNATGFTINGAEMVTIDDYTYYINHDESTNDIVLIKHYTRNVTSGNFGSICLPNGASVSDLTDTGIAKVLEVTAVTNDRVVMNEVEEEMEAGVPYIFKSNAAKINLTMKGEAEDEPKNTTQNYLVGNFVVVDVPNSNNDNDYNYYILQSNQFKKVTSSTIRSGRNRCYLKVSKSEMSRQSTLGIAVDESGATGIDAINSLMNNDAEIYDLNGRRLNDLRKGINIVNGVKVIVK